MMKSMRAKTIGRAALAAVVVTGTLVGGLGLAAGLALIAVQPEVVDAPTPVVAGAALEPPTRTSQEVPSERLSAWPPLVELPGRISAGTHTFPIAADSDYSSAHHDYPASDIFADCGSPVVAPIDGQVSQTATVDRWDPDTNLGEDRGGLSFTLIGADGVRYYGSHLATVTVEPGDLVRSGQPVGTVGETGSAADTGCHLHLGLSPAECGPDDWFVRRGVVLPYEYLRSWAEGVDAFPDVEVSEWQERNGCPTDPTVYP